MPNKTSKDAVEPKTTNITKVKVPPVEKEKAKNNQHSAENKTKTKPTLAPQPKESGEQTASGVLVELGEKKLIYTRHAECRMDCRYISESEIKDILKRGKINHRKSKPYDAPCPSYAVEGVTKDNQEVRIVFAKCDYATKVITAIDLGRKYSCHCD